MATNREQMTVMVVTFNSIVLKGAQLTTKMHIKLRQVVDMGIQNNSTTLSGLNATG